MDPDKFHPNRSPGRLVKTDFSRTQFRSGELVQREETGWAFIPHPPPELQEIIRFGPGELLALSEQAVAALGRLDGFFRQSPGGFNIDPWLLYRPLRLREARLSSRIENTVASAAEVEAATLLPSGRSEPIEIRNYLSAIELGAQREGPITEASIRALHRELLSGVPNAEAKFPGAYRPRQVFLGDEGLPFSEARFVPPPPEEVAQLMHQFVEYLRIPPVGMPALFAAGIAHYQFETIHPFADGNGRLGRLLITLSLCDGNLLSSPLIYPSGYINQNKDKYYDLLLRVSTHGDWTSWLTYFLQAVLSEAQSTHDRMNRLFHLREDYLHRTSDKSLGRRFTQAVDFIFERSVLTVPMLHDKIGGTQQTARNYVDLLVEKRVLHKVAKHGRQNVYFAPEIHSVADED